MLDFLLILVVAAAILIGEAWAIWTLCSRAYEARILFLENRIGAQDALLKEMADRLQFPTPQARVEAARAEAEKRLVEAMTPEQIQEREIRITEEAFWKEKRYLAHPDLANHEVSEGNDGLMYVTNWNVDPPTTEPIDPGTFFLRYARS